MVAQKDGKIIGGLRLIFSDENKFLSHEVPGTEFEYKKFIKKFDQRENLIIGEISSLVVEKNSCGPTITSATMDLLFKEAINRGCHYIFGVATALVCRNDRKIILSLVYVKIR